MRPKIMLEPTQNIQIGIHLFNAIKGDVVGGVEGKVDHELAEREIFYKKLLKKLSNNEKIKTSMVEKYFSKFALEISLIYNIELPPRSRGISLPKISYTLGKNPFVFKKNPSKIRINPFVLKRSRTLFPMSEVPLAQG